jgi:hypothetical protein
MGRAGVHSVLCRASLSDANIAGLMVDTNAFAIARQAIDHMEQEQLQFVNSAACV